MTSTTDYSDRIEHTTTDYLDRIGHTEKYTFICIVSWEILFIKKNILVNLVNKALKYGIKTLRRLILFLLNLIREKLHAEKLSFTKTFIRFQEE